MHAHLETGLAAGRLASREQLTSDYCGDPKTPRRRVPFGQRARWLAGCSIVVLSQQIDAHHQRQADQRHQQPTGDQTGDAHHHRATEHGCHYALFFAVNPVADANGAPQQRGEEKAGTKIQGSKVVHRREASRLSPVPAMAKAFVQPGRPGWFYRGRASFLTPG